MKMKFITLFTPLIVASLGLAHPASVSNNTSTPIVPPSNKTSLTDGNAPQLANVPPQELDTINAVINELPGGISKDCGAALLNLVSSPEFLKCIPPASLVALAPLAADPTIISNFIADPRKNYPPLQKPLVQFSTLFCPAPKCSDKGVAGAIKIIADGCKEDLSKKNQLVELIFTATVLYSPLHDSICFQDGKNFCWDETISTVIKLPDAKPQFALTKNPVLDSVIVSDPKLICTTCNKQIVNTFLDFLVKNAKDPNVLAILQGLGITQDKINQGVLGAAVKCGQDFVDGQIPK